MWEHSFLIGENQKKRVSLILRENWNPDEIIEGGSKWTTIRFVRKQRLSQEDIKHEDTLHFGQIKYSPNICPGVWGQSWKHRLDLQSHCPQDGGQPQQWGPGDPGWQQTSLTLWRRCLRSARRGKIKSSSLHFGQWISFPEKSNCDCHHGYTYLCMHSSQTLKRHPMWFRRPSMLLAHLIFTHWELSSCHLGSNACLMKRSSCWRAVPGMTSLLPSQICSAPWQGGESPRLLSTQDDTVPGGSQRDSWGWQQRQQQLSHQENFCCICSRARA